jgi:AcrR family transcriptional regulator
MGVRAAEPKARLGAEAWVDAGLAALAAGGLDAVRVEVLAQMLGVTKGGFYRRFKDRPALLAAMLEAWAQGRIAAIERQTALDGLSPADRLRAIVRLFAERANTQGLTIELAVRQWARNDPVADEAVARVDAARMAAVRRLYELMGFPRDAAQARAVLLYAFIFGQGLLHLPKSRRAGLLAACAELMTGPAA